MPERYQKGSLSYQTQEALNPAGPRLPSLLCVSHTPSGSSEDQISLPLCASESWASFQPAHVSTVSFLWLLKPQSYAPHGRLSGNPLFSAHITPRLQVISQVLFQECSESSDHRCRDPCFVSASVFPLESAANIASHTGPDLSL